MVFNPSTKKVVAPVLVKSDLLHIPLTRYARDNSSGFESHLSFSGIVPPLAALTSTFPVRADTLEYGRFPILRGRWKREERAHRDNASNLSRIAFSISCLTFNIPMELLQPLGRGFGVADMDREDDS